MKNIAYYNGKIGNVEDMMIPMNERSSWFGDGVYDAMFTINHIPLALEDHLHRFYRSARAIDIEVPMPFEELREMVLRFCREIDSPDAMAYVQATRGVGMRGHAYRFVEGKPSLWVFVTPDVLDPTDREYSCITMEDTRYFHCNIKTINLLPSGVCGNHPAQGGQGDGMRPFQCAYPQGRRVQNSSL